MTTTSNWRERALERSQVITDAWEVTKTWAGRIADWILFGCMMVNIVEIIAAIPVQVSNAVLGVQVVMLDVGGFSLATMGEQAREQGDERAAHKATLTGYFLIGVTILTLLLVTIGLLWPKQTKQYTDGAEKALILVRIVMTVIYGHVIHSLRRATVQRQQATYTEQYTELTERLTESEHRVNELVERMANELSEQFTQQLQRTSNAHPARSEIATINEIVTTHAHTLSELAALPALLEELRQEVETIKQAQTEQRHLPVPNRVRPKLSVVEANTEDRRPNTAPKERTERTRQTESDKGTFVRSCLAETPNIRNADIQRKASERGMTISPAYISEVRKAFTQEQSA